MNIRRLLNSSFAPAGMCYDPVTLTYAVVALGTVYTGYQQKQASDKQAEAIEEQARIAKSESERAAQQKDKERRQFLAEQRMAYLANGVTLEGTPVIVGKETWQEFQNEIDAIKRSGINEANYLSGEASRTKATGRAQLTGSVFQAAGTMATGASKSGMFSGGAQKGGSVSTTYYPTETIYSKY